MSAKPASSLAAAAVDHLSYSGAPIKRPGRCQQSRAVVEGLPAIVKCPRIRCGLRSAVRRGFSEHAGHRAWNSSPTSFTGISVTLWRPPFLRGCQPAFLPAELWQCRRSPRLACEQSCRSAVPNGSRPGRFPDTCHSLAPRDRRTAARIDLAPRQSVDRALQTAATGGRPRRTALRGR